MGFNNDRFLTWKKRRSMLFEMIFKHQPLKYEILNLKSTMDLEFPCTFSVPITYCSTNLLFF